MDVPRRSNMEWMDLSLPLFFKINFFRIKFLIMFQSLLTEIIFNKRQYKFYDLTKLGDSCYGKFFNFLRFSSRKSCRNLEEDRIWDGLVFCHLFNLPQRYTKSVEIIAHFRDWIIFYDLLQNKIGANISLHQLSFVAKCHTVNKFL